MITPSPPTINSLHNPFYRHCLKLRENRKRRKSGQLLIDGTMEICRAVEAGVEVQRLLVSSESELPKPLQEILSKYPQIIVQSFSPRLMGKLCYGQMESEAVALASEPNWEFSAISLKKGDVVLVLDQIEKPGNLGACVRSAVATGCSAVLLTRAVCDVFCSNSIRASRGAIFQIPIAVTTPSEVIQLAQAKEIPIFAARLGERRGLWELSLSGGAFLVFGNETTGLDEHWNQESVQCFSIPMHGGVDSLNLSISAAVSMYEAVRQKATAKI